MLRPTGKKLIILLVLTLFMFAITPIGYPTGYFTSAPSWIGEVGWLGSMIGSLLVIVTGVYFVVARMRHPREGGALPH